MLEKNRTNMMDPKIVLLLFSAVIAINGGAGQYAGSKLAIYVDELPQIPKLYGYRTSGGEVHKTKNLTIGMYSKTWKFHRDLPETSVFVYGKSKKTATFPGPLIEAIQGVPTTVTWKNHLPKKHILPWDPTIPTAKPSHGGIPTVVHLHGGVTEPESDGNGLAWFTAGFKEKGPMWTKSKYTYLNVQHPGNLWYHDHTVGLTRVNLLAGLIGPYVIRNPSVEAQFNLPSGDEFDRHLIIADRSFDTNGSIYMNSTGNNPRTHPQWQPEYFGDAITVNGKAWPFLKIQRRSYRFRIINTSNARFFRLSLSDGVKFTVIGSDGSYLPKPVVTDTILMSPAEIFDVVVDFKTCKSTTTEIELTNDAPYPFSSGTPAGFPNNRVMKFVLDPSSVNDDSKIPAKLMTDYPKPSVSDGIKKRYIVLYEYTKGMDEPTHLYINGKRSKDPVSETPRSGSTEVWEVINLTEDNHPLHIHLAMFQPVKVRQLLDLDKFTKCMKNVKDAGKCNVSDHAVGKVVEIPEHEMTWKNVVKMAPGFMTTVVVKFNLVINDTPFPFDATGEPGYAYHCHILDHEDNQMMRPLKLIK